MERRTKIVTGLVAAGVIVAATGAGVAMATSDDDETDTPITGSELEEASKAALDHTGEGKVTGTEVGDEESYYEVEVTLEDGSQVDVQLDESFAVVGSEADSDESEDDD